MPRSESVVSDKKDDFSTILSGVCSNRTMGSEATAEQLSLWQNIKKFRKISLVTFGLTSGILLYGYDYVIVGTVSAMPGFQHDFGAKLNNKWIIPAQWLALWNVASPFGGMLGALYGGWLQDKIGRRRSLASCAFVSAIGIAVMYVSYLPHDITSRRVLFLVGKFLQGGSMGGVMATCQTYMSEVLPPVLRGSGMAFFPAFTLLGQLIGALVIFSALNRPKGYIVAFASQWPFSFVPILVAYLIPESPTWLVRKCQLDAAHTAQARLDPPGSNTHATITKLLADIEHEERSAHATFHECFQSPNLRRTAIVILANALPAMFGLHLLAKASYFLQLINMKPSTSIVFLILGIILGLLANIASIWVVARVDRRPLILTTLLIAVALWASMGLANSLRSITPAVTWWTAVSMMLVIISVGLGAWPASVAIAAEASSLHLRAKTQGVGWAVNALCAAVAGVVLPYVFNPDQGDLRGRTGWTFAASCAVGVVAVWWGVPEMREKGVAEIDEIFAVKRNSTEGIEGMEMGDRIQNEAQEWSKA